MTSEYVPGAGNKHQVYCALATTPIPLALDKKGSLARSLEWRSLELHRNQHGNQIVQVAQEVQQPRGYAVVEVRLETSGYVDCSSRY